MKTKKEVTCPHCKRPINWIQVVRLIAEEKEDDNYPVRVYICPNQGCEKILSIVPDSSEYLEDVVAAVEDAGNLIINKQSTKKSG